MKIKITKLLGILVITLVTVQITNAAKMYFTPTGSELINDCGNKVDIMIDTEGKEIMGGAANIMYDPNKIEIAQFYPNEEFNVPVPIRAEKGKLRTAMLSAKRNNEGLREGFEGVIKYGTIIVSNKEGANNANIELEFYGENDGRPASRVYLLDANNTLREVENGSFSFVEGVCPTVEVQGENYLSDEFDFNANLAKNVKDIEIIENDVIKKLTGRSYVSIIYSIIALIIIIIILLIIKKKRKYTKKK